MFRTARWQRRWQFPGALARLLVALPLVTLAPAAATAILSILPKYAGPPTDFARVVPVPALPEVAAADADLFRQLSALTSTARRSRDSFWSCGRNDYDALAPGGRDDGGRIGVDSVPIGECAAWPPSCLANLDVRS